MTKRLTERKATTAAISESYADEGPAPVRMLVLVLAKRVQAAADEQVRTILADDLARYFSNMGAVILGPAATPEQAATHTQTAEAAILASNQRKSTGKAVTNALFPPSARDGEKPVSSDDVFALLPKLRLAARLLLEDVNASDLLVERTLERAIRDIDRKQADLSTEDWLNCIMRNVAKSSGAGLLH